MKLVEGIFPALLLLLLLCDGVIGQTNYLVGNSFLIRFTSPDLLQVFHRNQTERVLWQSISGTPFLSSAIGNDTFPPGNGHFRVNQNNKDFCSSQSVTVSQFGSNVLIQGNLSGNNYCNIQYTLEFSQVSEKQLGFKIFLDPKSTGYDRTFLTFSSPADEEVYGLGEQFSFFNNKGEKFPLLSREQGVGRGLQPITYYLNLGGKFSGGDRYTSYFGIPHYITTYNRSLFLENSELMVFDLLKSDQITIEVASLEVRGRILYGNSPLELIEEYTTYSGRMKPLPDWINKGAVVGMQGGEKKVLEILSELEKLGTPIGAFWNQDWCGNRIQYVGEEIQKRLWWNWEPDRQVYPNWEELVEYLRSKDIRMMTYINTFLTDVSNKTSYDRNLYKEALALDYFVKNPDGTTYMIESGPGIVAGIIDLTNPGLFQWMKEIIKQNMIGTGASGWMADFGEYIPFDVSLYNGNSFQYKNLYPQEWARLNQEAAAELGLGDDIVYFMRAAFSQSPKYTSLLWAGDQMPTWDLFDGLKSVVVGLVSAGLSGFSLHHSDIGGFSTSANNPPPLPSYVRSRELFYRWSEFAALTTVFRTHEGSQPEENVQFYTDAETYEYFDYCSKLYASLAPYRKQLMQESAQKGYPLARHLYLHYPTDLEVRKIVYNEYLLGSDLLAAPVLDEGSTQVTVYLPKGTWYHIWSDTYYESQGMYVTVAAPLREPGIFIKEEAVSGNQDLRGLLDFARLRREQKGA